MSTFQGSFTLVKDFKDVYVHSFLSIMSDLRNQGPPDGKYYEIRLVKFLSFGCSNVLQALDNMVSWKY